MFAVAIATLAPTAPAVAQTEVTEPLCKTTWAQRRGFAVLSPKKLRLGCWSTAIAQIAYYHRLAPKGKVAFTTTKGFKLKATLPTQPVDFDLLVPKLTSGTAELQRAATVRYNYDASLVVQKDFGTGTYCLNAEQIAKAVSKFYNVRAHWATHKTHNMTELETIIVNELKVKRPLMIHMRTERRPKRRFTRGGHAAVIDGYRYEGSKLMVHINMGHGGHDDGWFPFAGPIRGYNDPHYRKLLLIRPKKPRSKLYVPR